MTETLQRFLNVFMDQNNKCNLKCRMCGFSDPRTEGLARHDMPFWLFEKIAADVFPRASYLALSCLTEPFMTRDFVDRLDLLKTHGVPDSEIITNGTLLDRDKIQKLIDVSISRVGISLDGATPQTYESIRVGARFERVIENIQLFNEMVKQSGSTLPALRLLHVISEKNVSEFTAFLDLAESLKPAFIDVRTILPFKNAQDQGSKHEAFWREIARCRELLEDWKQRTGVQDTGYLRPHQEPGELYDEAGERRLCRAGSESIAIHFNGDVVPCMAWEREPLGNLATQTLDELWNGQRARSVRNEYADRKPGLDCLHCPMVRSDVEQPGDPYIVVLSKQPPAEGNSSQQ